MDNALLYPGMEIVHLFTDGSCWKNVGGWGLLLRQPSIQYEMTLNGYEHPTTNNRMELTAVIKGLEALKEPCLVEVTSDSQYVVGAFVQKWIVRWQANSWLNGMDPLKNADLWVRLWDLTHLHRVNFNWVHGHKGHVENEICDKLALHARKELEGIMLSSCK